MFYYYVLLYIYADSLSSDKPVYGSNVKNIFNDMHVLLISIVQ